MNYETMKQPTKTELKLEVEQLREQSESWRKGCVAWQEWATALLGSGTWGDDPARRQIAQRLDIALEADRVHDAQREAAERKVHEQAGEISRLRAELEAERAEVRRLLGELDISHQVQAKLCSNHREQLQEATGLLRRWLDDEDHAEDGSVRSESTRFLSPADAGTVRAPDPEAVARILADPDCVSPKDAAALVERIAEVVERREQGYRNREHGDVLNKRCMDEVVELVTAHRAQTVGDPAEKSRRETGDW